jgi:two-component system cell cycle sensor histidine kinase PleC
VRRERRAGAPAKPRPAKLKDVALDDAAILREIARRIRDGIDAGPRAPHDTRPPDAPPGGMGDTATVLLRLAHELKTPLSAIVAAAEIMSQEQLGPMPNERYLDYSAEIASNGRHALTLVDRILQDGGNGEIPQEAAYDFTQVDLNPLVERTASVLAPLARRRGQHIVTDVESKLPHIVADTTSLRQILLNLLTNAVKYAAPDSDVVVATRSVLDGPVILEVRDAGPGMSADAVSRALADNPAQTETTTKGHGIGLPLVRRLAEANGARMSIASAPGCPTIVAVTFGKDRVVPV